GVRAAEPTLPPVAGAGRGREKWCPFGSAPVQPKCDLLGCKDPLFAIDSLQTPFGLLRVFSVVIPFLYVGTQISKNFAALLEEHDIFVPEDDDDDD
ncbi:EMRE protein, partial [Pteruthius melanotis]|nr:EMRE protein [Pteruthius melanotis]